MKAINNGEYLHARSACVQINSAANTLRETPYPPAGLFSSRGAARGRDILLHMFLPIG